MKRSRLKPRSDRRPAWEDRELRAAYCDHNDSDELWPVLEREHPALFAEATKWLYIKDINRFHVDPHHIFHCRARWDKVSNLIALCRPVHDWIQGRAQTIGTVIALYYKHFEKGECDPAELKEASGMELVGWLSFDRVREACERDEAAERKRVELLNALEGV